MGTAGLHELVVQAVEASPPVLHGALYGNVVLVGGTSRLPGLRERLERELQSLAPSDVEVRVCTPADPLMAAWRGGELVARSGEFEQRAISQAEYEEQGARRLRGWIN